MQGTTAGSFVPLCAFNLRDTNCATADFSRIQSLHCCVTQAGEPSCPRYVSLPSSRGVLMVSPPSFIFPPTFPRRHRTVWTYKSHRSCGLPFNTYEERGAIFLKSYIQCLKWTRKYHPASPSFLQSRARCFPPPGMLSPTATPAPTGMTPTPASSTVSQQFPCNFQSMGPGDGAEEQGVGQ